MLHKIIKELQTKKANPEEYIFIPLGTAEMLELIPQDRWPDLDKRSAVNEQKRSALAQVNLLLIAGLSKNNPQAAVLSGVLRDHAMTNMFRLSSLLTKLSTYPFISVVDGDPTELLGTISMEDINQPGVSLTKAQRKLLITVLSNSISSLEKDVSNHKFLGRDIFSKDLCADCQARLLRKYPKRSLHIPARMQRQKEFDFCMAYILAAWHGLFRSMDSFCNYSSRVGEEYKHALEVKGVEVNYIDRSGIRKILERNLEKREMKFLEKWIR